MRRARQFGAFVIGALAMIAPARAHDPALAPGRDPSGTVVAVIADGFDYTRPEVSKVLARDGEGEAIARDIVDGDHRPFLRDGDGTRIALAAATHGGVRIVPIRVAFTDPASLARGIAFASETPARIVLVPLAAETRARLEVLVAGAKRFEATMFVASAPSLTTGERTQSEGVPNLVLLDSADSELVAAEAVARALGCVHGALSAINGAELKRAFLDRLESGSPPVCDQSRSTESK